jgi:hypothetical protein
MTISPKDAKLFYNIWFNLLTKMNERHNIVDGSFRSSISDPLLVIPGKVMEIRDAMWNNPQWLDEFLSDKDNGTNSDEERQIIALWRKHFIKGKFLAVKRLSKYVAVMTMDNPSVIYGVKGIVSSLDGAFPMPMPVVFHSVLLPFKGDIIYDSLAIMLNISFGPGVKRTIKKDYDSAKKQSGIITTLG